MMASSRKSRQETCAYENCGSRRFHVGDDGYTYCDQGHQQSQRGTAIADDTGEFAVLGRTSRKRDSDAESTTSKASSFSGSRAFEHYLLCLQLVLRKQLRWLIDVQKLPEELETLVRDLWALRLQKVQSKITYDSETDTEAQSSSQPFSSQSESESTATTRSSRRSQKRSIKSKEKSPALLETLTFCYVGMLLLRVPITVADIRRWVNCGELLYYGASREVPLEMRERLPGTYQELLEPQDLLPSQALHGHVLEMLTTLNSAFGMVAPPINVPLVLFRWTKELGLPLEVFAATQKLARLLESGAEYILTANHKTDVALRYPEVRLVALLVVATKLLFPLDESERHPYTTTELSSLSLNWHTWITAQQAYGGSENPGSDLSFEQAYEFTESDCLEVADEKLDAYLAWCENNIATEDVRERGRAGKEADLRKTFFRMFPLRSTEATSRPVDSQPGHSVDGRLREVQSTLSSTQSMDSAVAASAEIRRPGSFYRRFRQAEELSGPATMFYKKASQLADSSLDGLIQAVFSMERKLQKHEERLRKKSSR